ncbi:uncharacterized protein [Palaemon carinicauda]|uniref:uncharacterized protein n=1 Tax=Palaemon carinicauda TaxID=392227 RepID=UPI0035B6795E
MISLYCKKKLILTAFYLIGSSRAATTILQLSATNDTETKHEVTTTTPNDTEVPAILEKPRVPVTVSSKNGTDFDSNSSITNKTSENLIAPITVNRVISTDVIEINKNDSITNKTSAENVLPSARPQQAESLNMQNSTNSPLTDVPKSASSEDSQHTSTNETEEYPLEISSLSTVATALEEDKTKDATSFTLPPELIFIIVLLSLALLEVGLVNAVNWWKARDGSTNGQRRSILSLLRLGLCKKTNNATYIDPLDDTTPIIPEV